MSSVCMVAQVFEILSSDILPVGLGISTQNQSSHSCCVDFIFSSSIMANLNAPMSAANVDSSVSASGPLAGMFGAPTNEPLIDSQAASSLAAPVLLSTLQPHQPQYQNPQTQ